MKTTTRDALRTALFEATFVVLGVVLALAANEWRQSAARSERAERALVGIVDELRTNREAVASALDYHQGLSATIRELAAGSGTPRVDTFSRGFVAPAPVYATAWQSAAATGVLEDLDFGVVLDLSRLYAHQERYEVQARGVSSVIYGELYRGGTEAVVANYRNLASLIHSFAYRERELLGLYDRTLAELGAKPAAEPASTSR